MTDVELQVLRVKARLVKNGLVVRDMAEQFNISHDTAALCIAACVTASRCRVLIPIHWNKLLDERGKFMERDLVESIAIAMGVATPCDR